MPNRKTYIVAFIFGSLGGAAAYLVYIFIPLWPTKPGDMYPSPPPGVSAGNLAPGATAIIKGLASDGDAAFVDRSYGKALHNYQEALEYLGRLEDFDREDASQNFGVYRQMRVSIEARIKLAEIGSILIGPQGVGEED